MITPRAKPAFADLEIRIRTLEDAGYPVEITLNHAQQYGGLLSPDLPKGGDGARLFAWLFADNTLKEAWEHARGQHPQRRIRLRLDADAPELHAMPWEALRDSDTDIDLAAADATPFSRYMAGTWPSGSPIPTRPIKMLVAIANPDDLGKHNLAALDEKAEWANLCEATDGLDIALTRLPPPCTLSAIAEELRQGYHVLHIVAHGAYSKRRGQAALYLADAENHVAVVPEDEFAAMLKRQLADGDTQSPDRGAQNSERVRLVFLASCESASRSTADAFRGLAPALVNAGVPAVVAMQDKVSIMAARAFSRTFYARLLEHGLVDLAGNQARAALLDAGSGEAAVPVVFMRMEDGRLFRPPAQLAPLSQYPKTRRFQHDHALIGRDTDLDWLRHLNTDALLVGQPGSGKTFLLSKFITEGEGLFVVSDNSADITEFLKIWSPKVVIVDDAQTRHELLFELKDIRARIGVSFHILATCWPSDQPSLKQTLTLPESQVHQLSLLTRDEIVEVIKATGLAGSNELIREIVNQAEGRPGLATTLTYLCLQGDVRQVVLGDAVSNMFMEIFKSLIDKHAHQILAAFAVGGNAGMSIKAVAEVLNMSDHAVQRIVINIAAGGVFFEVSRQYLSIRPPALREVLVRDVFFNAALSLPDTFLALLERAPELVSSIDTLIGAKARGGSVPTELLTQLVETADSEYIWQAYVQLGHKEATWVFQNHPEVLAFPWVARYGLPLAPETALPLLLEKAIGDERQIHNHTDHPLRIIRDWVLAGIPGSEQPLERRKSLLQSIHSWSEKGQDVSVAVRTLEFILSPNFENLTPDPGSGSNITMRRRLVSVDELHGIQKLWPSVLKILQATPITTWSPIRNLVEAWMYPGRFNIRTSPETSEIAQAFAVKLLHDLIPLIEPHPGLCHWAKQISDRLTLDFEIPLDTTFEILYPQRVMEDIDNWRTAQKQQEHKVQTLADIWKQLDPAQVLQHLVWIEAEANLVDMQGSPWTRFLCVELAESTTQLQLWIELMLKTDLPSNLLEPFLDQSIRKTVPGWEELINRCLEHPKLQEAAISPILTLPAPPDDLLSRVFTILEGHSDLVRILCLKSQISVKVLRQLLRHQDPAIVTAAVIGEWDADPKKTVRESLRQDWKTAMIHSVINDHWLSEIFEKYPSLAYPWLQARLDEKLPLIFTPTYKKAIQTAIDVLDAEKRSQILYQLPDTDALAEMVTYLIGKDMDLYQKFLESKQYKFLHLVPLSCAPEDVWIEMAKLASDAGYSSADIAKATRQYTGVSIEWGPVSQKWEMWMRRFGKLCEHEDARIREIGRIGLQQSEARYKQWLKHEQDEAVYERGGRALLLKEVEY